MLLWNMLLKPSNTMYAETGLSFQGRHFTTYSTRTCRPVVRAPASHEVCSQDLGPFLAWHGLLMSVEVPLGFPSPLLKHACAGESETVSFCGFVFVQPCNELLTCPGFHPALNTFQKYTLYIFTSRLYYKEKNKTCRSPDSTS